MDDWLDAGDDESALAERHSARMEREFGDAGYLEGLEVAKETRMQEGFNLGFKEACRAGLELGFARGLLSVLAEAQPAANVAHEKEAQRVLAQHQPQTWIDTAYVAQHAKQDTTLPSTASSLVTRATDEAERAVSSSTDLAALQSQHAFWRQ